MIEMAEAQENIRCDDQMKAMRIDDEYLRHSDSDFHAKELQHNSTAIVNQTASSEILNTGNTDDQEMSDASVSSVCGAVQNGLCHERRLSVQDLCHNPQDSTVAREQEIAKFLSEMREGSHSNPTSPAPPPTPTPDQTSSLRFLSRVTQFPVVNSTIRTIGEVYESSKNTSVMLKYSAETVESSVRTIFDSTKPMLSRFEPSLEQLDEFACRQLDKLEKSYPAILESQQNSFPVLNEAASVLAPGLEPNDSRHSSGGTVSSWNSYFTQESLNTLKFCLEWLRYATAHIDAQIQLLRSALTSFSNGHNISYSPAVMSLLSLAASVKREVVETLKRVVDIIGKYAGTALPLEARNLVRGFILSLPGRWASVNKIPVQQAQQYGDLSQAGQEAQRVLTLAEESNSILKSTMAVFGNTMQATEYLFGRDSIKQHQE